VRRANQSMEFIWKAAEMTGMGTEGDVFTGAFVAGSYGPPAGLCFDGSAWCDDTNPFMSDDCLEDNNAQDLVRLCVCVCVCVCVLSVCVCA